MTFFRDKTVIGLTGGIASGKSTALQRFNYLGWSAISTDSIVAKVLQEDSSIKECIVQRWGGRMVRKCGSIDKMQVGEIVFGSNHERIWLESLIHPIVRSHWISYAQSCSNDKCVVEIPLLFENNLQNNFHCTLSMFSSNQTVLERLLKRGLTQKQSEARISSQLPSLTKASMADFVLWGSGSEEFLNLQVDAMSSLLQTLD